MIFKNIDNIIQTFELFDPHSLCTLKQNDLTRQIWQICRHKSDTVANLTNICPTPPLFHLWNVPRLNFYHYLKVKASSCAFAKIVELFERFKFSTSEIKPNAFSDVWIKSQIPNIISLLGQAGESTKGGKSEIKLTTRYWERGFQQTESAPRLFANFDKVTTMMTTMTSMITMTMTTTTSMTTMSTTTMITTTLTT